jgi:hypothetical protein
LKTRTGQEYPENGKKRRRPVSPQVKQSRVKSTSSKRKAGGDIQLAERTERPKRLCAERKAGGDIQVAEKLEQPKRLSAKPTEPTVGVDRRDKEAKLAALLNRAGRAPATSTLEGYGRDVLLDAIKKRGCTIKGGSKRRDLATLLIEWVRKKFTYSLDHHLTVCSGTSSTRGL